MCAVPAADLIVGPGIVITQDVRRAILRDAVIAVTDGIITYVGDAGGAPPLAPHGEQLDAGGQFIVPGFIDTHTHLYQTLMKGLGDDMGLMVWLERLTLPTIPHLTGRDTYLGAMVGLAEAIRSGTTTVLDFFVASDNLDWSTNIARAYAETGVRGYLGLGMAEKSMPGRLLSPLSEQFAAIDALAVSHSTALFQPMYGPGTSWRMTKHGLTRIREEANRTGLGITIHLNEATYDNEAAMQAWGTGNVPVLDETGFLGPDVVLAHCCYLTHDDIGILARTGACVSNNPVSNMYLGNQFARVPEMLHAGVTVALGPDGAASNNTQDMFEALKMCALVQKGHHEDAARLTAQQALDIATLGGAKGLRREHDLGSLEVGKQADLFVFDPRDVRCGPWHEPVSAIVYSGGERNVRATVVAGKVLMRDGELLTVDERELVEEAQGAAGALRQRAGTGYLLNNRAWSATPVLT